MENTQIISFLIAVAVGYGVYYLIQKKRAGRTGSGGDTTRPKDPKIRDRK